MTSITLKGILGKRFGENWNLEVSSVAEIFEAIEANTSKVSQFFNDLNKFATHFVVFVDGEMMPAHLINSKILKSQSKVEVIPVIQGGFFWMFVIGLVLTVLSVVITKALSPKAPKDIKTSSAILGKIRNVTNRNIVVPLGYGRMRVGSAVVSNNIKAVYQLDPEYGKGVYSEVVGFSELDIVNNVIVSSKVIK